MFHSMRIRGNQSKCPATGGFTLAELLVVVAIAAIMFTIALPSFVNLAGTSKLDSAASAVHAAAKLARQYALTHNQPTYLVFHDDQSTADPNLAYRSYAIFTINTHTNAVPVPQSAGYFLTDWETLPAGVVFDDAAGGTYNMFSVSTGATWLGAISKNNELKIQGASYVVLGFKPTGKAGSTTHWIYLAEGFYNNGQIQHAAKQGKQIRFDMTGKSQILDIVYNEAGEAVGL